MTGLTFGLTVAICMGALVLSGAALNTVKNQTLGKNPIDGVCYAAVTSANPGTKVLKQIIKLILKRLGKACP